MQISKTYTHYAATILFFFFGFKTLYDVFLGEGVSTSAACCLRVWPGGIGQGWQRGTKRSQGLGIVLCCGVGLHTPVECTQLRTEDNSFRYSY